MYFNVFTVVLKSLTFDSWNFSFCSAAKKRNFLFKIRSFAEVNCFCVSFKILHFIFFFSNSLRLRKFRYEVAAENFFRCLMKYENETSAKLKSPRYIKNCAKFSVLIFLPPRRLFLQEIFSVGHKCAETLSFFLFNFLDCVKLTCVYLVLVFFKTLRIFSFNNLKEIKMVWYWKNFTIEHENDFWFQKSDAKDVKKKYLILWFLL